MIHTAGAATAGVRWLHDHGVRHVILTNAAGTLNAAHAVGLGDEVGSLAPGKRADLLVLDVENHRQLPYHHGVNHVARVIHHGEVVE